MKLKPCPFCGGTVRAKWIGNAYSRKRFMEIWCYECHIVRRKGEMRHNFDWLEDVISKAWNRRSK